MNKMNLENKIAIVGVSASGKSTFARSLAAKTNLPLTHMDAVMWQPGWNYIGDEETIRKLNEVSSQEKWIIEGYIDKGAYETVFSQADTIVYLDYPRHVAAWRYIKRWFKHRKHPRPELEGSPEKFSFTFLKLVWEKREVYHLNNFLQKMSHQEKILKLTSPRKAKTFLDGI